MHVVVDLIRIEIWMVQNLLYQVLEFISVGAMFSDMFLKNAFTL